MTEALAQPAPHLRDAREIPEPIIEAGEQERDPDRRILMMLAARGSHVAADQAPKAKEAAFAAS